MGPTYSPIDWWQALARLRFSETVAQSDVDEALRLMQMSKFSLYSDDRQRSGLDAISDIYSILRDEAARTNGVDISYAHALNWISRKVSPLDGRTALELLIHDPSNPP